MSWKTSAESDKKDEAGVWHVSAEEAAEQMAEEKDFVIVDVREAAHFEREHIKGALSIPASDIDEERPAALPDLKQPLYLYCTNGICSKIAAERLAEMGYENVSEMGAVGDWKGEMETGEE